MKKPVDIHKLVEDKYAKSNDSLRMLFEQIDAVLEASNFAYPSSKINPEDLEEVSQSENVYDHAHGMGGAENERAPEKGYQGTEPSEVVPDKLTMETTALQTTATQAFEVPDLYTLITNSKMDLSDDDRKLINEIVENISPGATDWRERIRAIKQFTSAYGVPATEPQDMRQAISSLIMLNVLKKISFFTAQAGKQFEYIFAPLIAPTAKVKGANDTNIVDVESAGGGQWGLKFFTSENPVAEGSRGALFDKKEGLKYILARSFAQGDQGVIEISEMHFVADLKTYIQNHVKTPYALLYQNTSLAFFRREGPSKGGDDPQFMCYIKNEREKSLPLESFIQQFQQYSTDLIDRSAEGGLERKPRQQVKKNTFTLGGKEFEGAGLDVFKPINRFIDSITSNVKVKDYDKALRIIKDNLPDFKEEASEKINKTPEEKNAYLRDVLAKLTIQKNDIIAAVKNAETRKKQLPENFDIDEARQGSSLEGEGGDFSVPLTMVWRTIVLERVSLGNPEVLNSHLLDLSNSINKRISEIFKSLQSLTMNLTKYFSTSLQKQKGDNKNHAQDSINDAQDIIDNVGQVASSEGISTVSRLKKK